MILCTKVLTAHTSPAVVLVQLPAPAVVQLPAPAVVMLVQLPAPAVVMLVQLPAQTSQVKQNTELHTFTGFK